MTRRQLLTGAAVAGTALTIPLVAPGCESSPKGTMLTKVRDVPGFTAAREGTPLVGMSLNYFKPNGIDLSVRLSDPKNSVQALVGHQAEVADADTTSILQQLAPPAGSGIKPVKGISIVGAMQKQCMFGIIFRKSNNWTGPADLAGKTLGCALGSAGYRLWPEYAKRAGIDPKATHFKFAPASTGVPDMLAANRVDAVVTYLTDIHTYQLAAGEPVVAMAYSDFVLDLLGTLWIARTDFCSDNPGAVNATVDALFRSVRYSVDHPADAAKRLAQAYPTFKEPANAAVFQAMGFYTPTADDGPWIAPERMARCIAALQGAGIISHLDPNTVVARNAMPSPSRSAS
jgi:NitT/TauT family transport system substrate-binding protein